MNRCKIALYSFLRLILILLISVNSFGKANTDPVPKYIKEGQKRLAQMVATNKVNDAKGLSHLNNYVLYIEGDRSNHFVPEYKAQGQKEEDIQRFVTKQKQNEINLALQKFYNDNRIALYLCLDASQLVKYKKLLKRNGAQIKDDRTDLEEKLRAKKNIIKVHQKQLKEASGLSKDDRFITIAAIELFYNEYQKGENNEWVSVAGKVEKKQIIYAVSYPDSPATPEFISTLNQGYAPIRAKFYTNPDTAFEELYSLASSVLKEVYKPELADNNGDHPVQLFNNGIKIVNQKSLAQYAEESIDLKNTNYESDIQRFSNALKNLISSGNYVSISETLSNQDALAALFIQDKIKAFSQETEGKYQIYIIAKEISYYLTKSDWYKFSQDVKSQAGLSNNALVITIPYKFAIGVPVTSATGTLEPKNIIFPFAGNNGYGENSQGDWVSGLNEYFNSVYTNVPKPLTIIDYIINFDGAVIRNEAKSREYIIGYDNVIQLRASYESIIKLYNTLMKANVSSGEGGVTPLELYQNLIDNSYNLENVKFNQLNIDAFKIKESFIRRHEKQIISKAVNTELEYFAALDFVEFGSLDIPDEASWVEPSDPIIITIDVLSLVASPVGGDYAFDAIGAIYSYYQGRDLDFVLYTGSAVAPFVSGGGTKLAKKILDNLPKLLAKGNKKEISEKVFKSIFKSTDNDIAKLLKQEFETQADELINSPILIGNIEVLGEASSKKLLKDFLGNKDLISALAKEPKLVDSWKVLDDAGVDDLIRKNVDEVEFIDDFIKNNPNKTKAQVASDINAQGYNAWKLANAGGKLNLLGKLDNFTSLKTWVNGLDDVADANLITKLDGLDAGYLAKLETDIASNSMGAGLKALLKESPDDLNDIWKILKDDPKYAYELS